MESQGQGTLEEGQEGPFLALVLSSKIEGGLKIGEQIQGQGQGTLEEEDCQLVCNRAAQKLGFQDYANFLAGNRRQE